MSFRVCVLTVTYGNRGHLVKEVVQRAFEEGVEKCVIVNNASTGESSALLKNMAKENPNIVLLSCEENLGSAGGYKIGLEKIEKEIPCDYILLLDDDNMLEQGALGKLKNVTEYLKDFPHPYALLCYRDLFEPQTEFIYHGCDFSYKYNAFASHNMLKNLRKKISYQFKKQKKNENNFFPLVRIDRAPYGGFFFSKNLLHIIEFPKDEFFVYADDIEYTYRLTKKGGYIFLCSEIKIKDIDVSYEHSSRVFWLFQEKQTPLKIYYYMRNKTYWYYNDFKRNSFIYSINMFLWFLRVIIAGIAHPKMFIKRFPVILRAVRDGHKGRLGKTYKEISSHLSSTIFSTSSKKR